MDPSGHTPASCAFTVHRDFDANISEVRIHSNFLRQCLIGKLEARDPVSLVKLVSHYSYLQTLLAALDFRAEFTERPDYGKSLYEGHILYANGSSELDLLLKAVVLFSPNDVDASRRSRYLHTFWYLEYYCVDIQHKSAINALTTINDKFQSHISSACYDSIDIAIPEVSSASRVGGILKKLQDHARESSSSQPVWGTFDELDDCLVWMVSETRSIWKTREDRILDALLHCPALRRIKDLISQLPLQDAARFSGWTIVFDYDVVQSLSKEDLALVPGCRTIRRLRPEEKEKIITKKLHNDFKTEDQKFRQSVSKICFRPESTFVTEKDKACVLRTTSHFTHRQVNQWQPLGTIPHHNPAQNNSFANSCRFIHKRYNKAWDKGIAVIRRFLQGKRPDTLEKICRLLQVAYAMGLQSTHRENFEVDFRNDLGRWRTIVPLHSVASFDAIVAAVWGKRFDKASSELDLEYGFNETLLQLQDLMSSLISGFPLVNIEKDLPETDGDNQSTDGSQCAIDITYEKVQKEVDKMPDPRAYSDSRRIPIDPVPADPIVVLMMAGAIFGFIFSFLLSKYPSPAMLLLYKSVKSLTRYGIQSFKLAASRLLLRRWQK